MATKPQVGTRMINDAGTCVTLADLADGETPKPGEFPIARVDELIAAGYERVTKEHIVPVQSYELHGGGVIAQAARVADSDD
jgi:hypothetical protein